MVDYTERSDFAISSLQGQFMVTFIEDFKLEGTFMFHTRGEIQVIKYEVYYF